MPQIQNIKDVELLQKMKYAALVTMKRITEGEKSSLDLGELSLELAKINLRIGELTQ